MGSEEENRINLNNVRREEVSNKEAPAPAEHSAKEPAINISSDAPIIFAIGLALLKDLLDYVGIGSLPAVGTVITFIFVIAIAMILFLAAPKYFTGNMIMLLGGGGVESFLFGLNFLPILTATVLAIYIKMIIKRKSGSGPLGSIIQKTLK